MFLEVSGNGVGHFVGQAVHFPQQHARVLLTSQSDDAMADEVQKRLRKFAASTPCLARPGGNGGPMPSDAGDIDTGALDVGHPVGGSTQQNDVAGSEIGNKGSR